MTKVLFLTESRGWSGGARQLLHLADGLRGLGWDVSIACPEGGDIFRQAKDRGFNPVNFFPRQDYDLVSAWRLARVLDERGIEILHAHHPRAHAVGLAALYFAKVRPAFVVTRRVSFPIPGHVFSRLKYCNARISRFIAVAESIRSILISAGVAPEKVVTIPSGVDLTEFKPRSKDEELTRDLKFEKGVPVVGLVANYGPWKGQNVFLKAAGILKRRGRPAVFVLAGRDTESPELKAAAKAEGLTEKDVRFLGFCQDVPRLLSLLDVSVNASTEGEGLSGALRESLAMEVPVVASDIGGNRELVSEGKTGRLFPPGDAAALARALEDIFSDPDAAKLTAQVGRARVKESFSLERMISATADLYRSLLKERA